MEHVFCIRCGEKILPTAKFCTKCGAEQPMSEESFVKTVPSTKTDIPEGVKGWSWGAFWLTWIWAIFNRTWIGLLTLVPLVNIVMWIVLSVKGREWAWKNNKWSSIEHFKDVQRKWDIAGWVLAAIGFVFGLIAVGFFYGFIEDAYNDYIEKAEKIKQEQQEPIHEKTSDSFSATESQSSDLSGASEQSPYPIPRLRFSKVELLSSLKQAGVEQHWIDSIAKYLSKPDEFWGECVAKDSGYALIRGNLSTEEARAWGEKSCHDTTKQFYDCLNDKLLDDAVICIYNYSSDIAENGD